jgi:hypothetical protein
VLIETTADTFNLDKLRTYIDIRTAELETPF